MSVYKAALLIVDILLIVGAVIVFFDLKKYLSNHKNETVGENEEQLNKYIGKFKILSALFIILGVLAFVLGVLGKINV